MLACGAKKKLMGVVCGHTNLASIAPELRPQKIKKWGEQKAKNIEKAKMIYGVDLDIKAKDILKENTFFEIAEDSEDKMEDAEGDGNPTRTRSPTWTRTPRPR